jgi:hypothetical protein
MDEFLDKEEIFTYYDLKGQEQKINCKKNSFAITYCQAPFIYKLSERENVVIHKENGEVIKLDNLELDEELSRSIFQREGEISRVEVFISKDLLSSN